MLNSNYVITALTVFICIYDFIEKTKNYLFTKKTYAPVTEKSPLFAVDCEMVSSVNLCLQHNVKKIFQRQCYYL